MKNSVKLEHESIIQEEQSLSFKRIPLYGLTFLFMLHFVLFVEPFGPDFVITKNAGFCFDCFGFATVYCSYAFNKLQSTNTEDEIGCEGDGSATPKRAWALKYLWEIKVNSVLLSLVLFFQILLFLKDGHQALGLYQPVDAIDFVLYTFPVWFLALLMAFCIYFAVGASRYYSKLSKPFEQDANIRTTSSQRLFGGFQIIFKFCVIASFIFPNLLWATAEQRFRSLPYFRIEFWPLILFVLFVFDISPSTPVRLLFLTPSRLIFQSKDMQLELVGNKKMFRLYVLCGILILIGQLAGIRKEIWTPYMPERYASGILCGFIFFRIAQMALGFTLSSIASDVRAFKSGFVYLLVDTLFSMLNLLLVLGGIITKTQFWKALDGSMGVYMVVFGVVLFYICVRVMLYVTRSVFFYNSYSDNSKQQIAEEVEEEMQNNQQNEISHLNDCFGVFLIATLGYFVVFEQFQLMEILPAFGIALFWLLSLVIMSHKTSAFFLTFGKAYMPINNNYNNNNAELKV